VNVIAGFHSNTAEIALRHPIRFGYLVVLRRKTGEVGWHNLKVLRPLSCFRVVLFATGELVMAYDLTAGGIPVCVSVSPDPKPKCDVIVTKLVDPSFPDTFPFAEAPIRFRRFDKLYPLECHIRSDPQKSIGVERTSSGIEEHEMNEVLSGQAESFSIIGRHRSATVGVGLVR
jgi:hypothetical protein